jgi:hypothetical protein
MIQRNPRRAFGKAEAVEGRAERDSQRGENGKSPRRGCRGRSAGNASLDDSAFKLVSYLSEEERNSSIEQDVEENWPLMLADARKCLEQRKKL